ncbi:MAG: hypothetical protein AAGD07_00610 [Planctomycetota bacterium]
MTSQRKRRIKPLRRVREPGEDSPRDAGFYLEHSGKVVTGEHEETRYEIVGCSCRSRYCSRCSVGRGYQLRNRILNHSVAKDWKEIQMWTFTLDPGHFADAKQAYYFVRESKLISRVIRKLRRGGWLLSRHYFVVLEWQANGWPHWHLIVNARYVPIDEVRACWNRYIPAFSMAPDRVGLGAVKFSVPRFAGGAAHAINYVTKYLVKPPKDPWPEWVMESRKNIPRYSKSQGFFTDGESKPSTASGDGDPDGQEDAEDLRPTIRQRVAGCRVRAVILRMDVFNVNGKSVTYHTYVGAVCMAMEQAAELLEVNPHAQRLPCPAERVSELLGQLPRGSLEDGTSGSSAW